MKHNTVHTWKLQKETKFGPSQTVPDQSLSIREIMVKHSRGIPVKTQMPEFHDADGKTDTSTVLGKDVRSLDIVEVQQYFEDIAENAKVDYDRLKQKRTEEEKTRSAKAEQEKREQWKKEFLEELKQAQK